MQLNGTVTHIHDFQFEDFALIGYHPHPAIKAAIALAELVFALKIKTWFGDPGWSVCLSFSR